MKPYERAALTDKVSENLAIESASAPGASVGRRRKALGDTYVAETSRPVIRYCAPRPETLTRRFRWHPHLSGCSCNSR